MSINKIECSDGRLTLHGDYVVYHQDGVQFELHGDGIPGYLKGSRKGNIFVSTNRVIFAPMDKSSVGSFSMNFQSIRGVEVKQPMFGANYIKGDVISEPEGNWQGRGTFNITFNSGGAIEFAEHFRQAVQTANRPGSHPMPPAGQQAFGIYNNPSPPPQPGYYNGPPYQSPYAPPPQPGYYGPPPPQPGYYGPPPPAGYYAAQPPPYRPPENPPPYPGQSGPSAQPSAPPPDFPGGAKAQEAYSSGQNVYVPANQPPPPPYSAQNKKNV